MQRLHTGPDVWSELSPQLRRARGRRRAAIAYVSSAAYDLLGLKAGDQIIVNAGTRALRAGATDPSVLRRWVQEGVEVLSHDTLHAKVVVFRGLAVVGSANASFAAQGRSNEAVVSSDDPGMIRDVRGYLDALAAEEAYAVDVIALDKMDAEYRPPRGGGLSGVTSQAPSSPLVEAGPWAMHVVRLLAEASPAAVRQERRDRRRVPRVSGLQRDYFEDEAAQAARLRQGHLLLLLWADDDGAQAALGRVFSHVPRRTLANVYYHYDANRYVALDELNETLRQAGRRPLEFANRTVRDQGVIATVLSAWGLP